MKDLKPKVLEAGSAVGTKSNRKEPLIIIAGPTATGKSAAAVDLALRCNGAVISADSMQVYRGMDIGSAKVTAEEMHGVDHYLIDCVEPTQEWNVVRFQQEARAAVREIRSRGQLPILCGGTGFYIQALLYDVDFTQMDCDRTYRQELTQIARMQGPDALYELLRERDPASAAAIHPHNVKRVIRALEFQHESGNTISEHNAAQRQKETAYDALYFVLTMDRNKLYERINRRVDRMMEQGLEEEVDRLRKAGLTSSDISMQGLGYKQIMESREGRYDIAEAVRLIKRDTRRFAKRQLTWFRRERDVIWVDRDLYPDEDSLVNFLKEKVTQCMEGTK